jgi:hypothetical protein
VLDFHQTVLLVAELMEFNYIYKVMHVFQFALMELIKLYLQAMEHVQLVLMAA